MAAFHAENTLTNQHHCDAPDVDRFIRLPHVLRIAGVSKPTLYRWQNAGQFPLGVKLGPNTTGWLKSEVDRWLRARADARVQVGAGGIMPLQTDDAARPSSK
jgi:prophage regulatory protein